MTKGAIVQGVIPVYHNTIHYSGVMIIIIIITTIIIITVNKNTPPDKKAPGNLA